jgi:hypothetical protein
VGRGVAVSRRPPKRHPSIEHFVRRYGRLALRQLVEDARAGRPGAHTAERLGVSRERVSQWRAAWLRQEVIWTPGEELQGWLPDLVVDP